jgi:hypothetical protein
MAKQTFTTGQVLTAAQMTSLQQTAMGGGSPSVKTASYVLVAADAGTVIQVNSTSATTITVNTALFSAGDSVQIQNINTGVVTITAGTATVNSAGSLALSQWEGGFLYFTSASASIFFDFVDILPSSYGLSAGKNAIINGGMDIWQRGTTFTATANLTYLADRWYNSTGTTLTVTRDTDVPTSPYFQYSLKMVGTGTNSIAMRIESANSIPLAGQTITFSFYAKRTSGAGALSVNFYYPSATDNFTSVTQIGSSNVVSSSPSSSWTRYQVSVAIGTNITTGLLVLIDNTNASTTFITGAQLELGSTATTFSRNASTIQGELAACQRYYYRSTGAADQNRIAVLGGNPTTSIFDCNVAVPSTFRGTVSAIDTANIGVYINNNNTVYSGGTWTVLSGVSTAPTVRYTHTSGAMTQGHNGYIVQNGATAGYFGLSAEL